MKGVKPGTVAVDAVDGELVIAVSQSIHTNGSWNVLSFGIPGNDSFLFGKSMIMTSRPLEATDTCQRWEPLT